MAEEALTNETIQEFLFTTRQKLNAFPELGPSPAAKDGNLEALKGILFYNKFIEDLMLAYETMGELKRDCDLSINIAEQLFEQKSKGELEKESVENMTDQLQKLEDDNQRISDYNKALESELESCRNAMEKMEEEAAIFDKERKSLENEARHAKNSVVDLEKRIKELESDLLEGKSRSDNENKELSAKLQSLEKSLQKANKDIQDLQKINEKLNSSIINKQKEINKLTEGIFLVFQ